MLKTQRCTAEMLAALGVELPAPGTARVHGPPYELLRDLVREEAKEFDDAMVRLQDAVECGDEDELLEAWAEVLDACCDVLVVVQNTTARMGVDLEPFFDEVHRTNMAKVGGPVRADGKRLKPPGWQPPQRILRELLGSQ